MFNMNIFSPAALLYLTDLDGLKCLLEILQQPSPTNNLKCTRETPNYLCSKVINIFNILNTILTLGHLQHCHSHGRTTISSAHDGSNTKIYSITTLG